MIVLVRQGMGQWRNEHKNNLSSLLFINMRPAMLPASLVTELWLVRGSIPLVVR